MVLSLGRAAKAVGRSKSALSRDVKAGKIPAVRNVDGSLSIDSAELYRVFPPVSRDTGSGNGTAGAERNLLLDQIADLRRRLDAETEERRRLTAALTDHRGPVTEIKQPPAARWPRRVLRWLVRQHV